MLNKIKDIYSESIQTQISASQLLSAPLLQASEKLVSCLLRGNKIIVCGQGRSYANAQFLVTNLLHRYDFDRPSFPSVLLSLDSAVGSAIVLDQQYQCLYQRQFNAVAQQGDILVVFSPTKNETAVLELVKAAFAKEIEIVALTGDYNEPLKGLLTEQDLLLSVPSNKESRILESHLLIINALCELIDHSLFSQ
ncbi:MAG: SIS domain-containing protein [Lonepinella koalarum]|nr:SIS domain-containing protein [Lonepinella koalarum]